MLIWYFSNNHDIYDYVGKLPEQHFSVWLFSNPGDNILFLWKFNEARISEWNIYNNSWCIAVFCSTNPSSPSFPSILHLPIPPLEDPLVEDHHVSKTCQVKPVPGFRPGRTHYTGSLSSSPLSIVQYLEGKLPLKVSTISSPILTLSCVLELSILLQIKNSGPFIKSLCCIFSIFVLYNSSPLS